MDPTVAVVVDSGSGIPPALAKEYDIQVVAHQLVWDGQVYLDGEDLTADVLYRRMRADRTYPTTTAPTLGQFLSAYQRAAQSATGIVSIHVAETLTSTVGLARQAAQQAEVPVRVVDSRTAATPQAFIALEAARAARSGASLDEVAAVAEACRARVGMFCALETLEHLRRGGRIGRAAILLGARLSIQPVVAVRDGQVLPVGVARTRRRALDQVLAETIKAVGNRRTQLAAFHGDALDEALELAERAREVLDCSDFFVAEFTPVMGAHAGPGVVGLAYCLEETA